MTNKEIIKKTDTDAIYEAINRCADYEAVHIYEDGSVGIGADYNTTVPAPCDNSIIAYFLPSETSVDDPDIWDKIHIT